MDPMGPVTRSSPASSLAASVNSVALDSISSGLARRFAANTPSGRFNDAGVDIFLGQTGDVLFGSGALCFDI